MQGSDPQQQETAGPFVRCWSLLKEVADHGQVEGWFLKLSLC